MSRPVLRAVAIVMLRRPGARGRREVQGKAGCRAVHAKLRAVRGRSSRTAAMGRGTPPQELPAGGQERSCTGSAGNRYDASSKDGKFVLVSGDDGSCSTLPQRADPEAIATSSRTWALAQISYKMTGENERPESSKTCSWRGYAGDQGDRQWLLLVSTVKEPEAGQVDADRSNRC